MLPGDRLVCAFVNSLAIGAEFKGWPLHITVVPWFRTTIASNELAAELQSNLDFHPFEVRMGMETGLGRQKTVNLVKLPTPLTDIEEVVRYVLKRHEAWLVDETTKRQRSFKPHVTAQSNSRLHEGDSFWCDQLYIVEQKGGHKTVVAEIGLG